MKKIILSIMTIFILTFSLNISNVNAVEKQNSISASNEDSNDSGAKIVKETEQDYYIQSTYKNGTTTDIADIKLNKKTNKMEAQVKINNNGIKHIKNYKVISHELNEDMFKATIQDKETHLVYNIDPTKLQASGVSPVTILKYLFKNGEKAAVKKHGKNAVKKAKIKKKYNVLTPKAVITKPNNIKHIMESKHHWNKVLFKADWPNVQRLISFTLRYGDFKRINAFSAERTLKINGHTVHVRYNPLAPNDSTSVGTAFVK